MYDVTIIGAGVAGVFLAYQLASSGQKILLLDKGKRLEDRYCPLEKGDPCNCETCDTYYGFGGLGKSEGKFNYSSGFGGELEQKVGSTKFKQLMDDVDAVLCQFGGDRVQKYTTYHTQPFNKAYDAGLQMIATEVRHLGTSLSKQVLNQIYHYLRQHHVFMRFGADVIEIKPEADSFILRTNYGNFQSKKVVIATGRSGADWLHQIWKSLGIEQTRTRVDLGIRVEMKAEQFRSILQDTFETKLAFRDDTNSAMTYCMNPNGRIVRKYQDGLVMPDGQNFREQGKGSSNLNFTLFVPKYFPTQQAADEYAYGIIRGINKDSDRIVVQRWGDLLQGKATLFAKMQANSVRPTLEADGGDITQELPFVYVDMLQKFFTRLELLIGESIHSDTLLYGVDAKFYAPIIETDPLMQTKIEGLYVIGDCSGVTHSLSQAAASGIYVGEHLKMSRLLSHMNESRN